MLAERTNKILGKGIALVNVTADLADVTFFALCLGLGLYVCVIVAISHSIIII